MIVTRFAPSPTGRLHLGHAASALFAFHKAQEAGGRFLLRIEDIDPVRCKDEYIDGILEDLHWLGLSWEEPVRRQSQHLADYQAALDKLKAQGLIYPCFCTRKEVLAEAAAAGHAPHEEEGEGPFYPGTCRGLSEEESAERAKARPFVWRLDMAKACALAGPLVWRDEGKGEIAANPARFGDVVLARKDVPTSYHLSVVVDDALQGITHVTRGVDLFGVTDIHVLLQKLLGLPQPAYSHHPLLLDENGRRFAKRDLAMTLAAMREKGLSAEEVARKASFTP